MSSHLCGSQVSDIILTLQLHDSVLLSSVQLVDVSVVVYSITPGDNGSYLWLDLVNDDTWQHSGEAAVYTHWHSGEPDDDSSTCAIMTKHSGWRDKLCSLKFSFLCEI